MCATVAGRWTAAGDARIDERDPLIGALGLSEALGDVELVAHAFAHWGADCFARLVGDFAIAVWDARERKLFLVRDALGVRPLVWSVRGHAVAFASQPAALRALSGMAGPPDETAILRFLLDRPQPLEGTFFEGVHRVPPASFVRVDEAGECVARRYWRLSLLREEVGSSHDLVEGFRERLETAVADRMRGLSEPGFEVSGGLDSSSVLGIARTMVRSDLSLPGYAIEFQAEVDSGVSSIDSIVEAAGISLTRIPESVLYDRTALQRSIGDSDSPLFIDGPVVLGATYPAAARAGTRVLLGGVDGDAVVSHGLARMEELAARFRWGELLRESRSLARRTSLDSWRLVRSQALVPMLPTRVSADYRRLRWGPAAIRDSTRLARPDLAEPFLSEADSRTRDHRRALRLAQIDTLEEETVPAFLEQLDAAAAHAGIELRHPFYDRRLVEYCVALPASTRLRDGWTRWIQRAALQGLVPGDILWAPEKVSLGGSLYSAIVRHHWGDIADLVSSGGGRAEPFVARDALEAAFRRAATGELAVLSDLLGLLRLHRWLQEVS
jgi:asparagine synthase (glutamine-hydrolysing)